MKQIYITEVNIEQVRHLQDIRIALGENPMKHLIITGKNGSGKTSVLHAMEVLLNALSTTNNPMRAEEAIKHLKIRIEEMILKGVSENEIAKNKRNLMTWQDELDRSKAGLDLSFNYQKDSLRTHFEAGEYILAYYEAEREFKYTSSGHIEKVELKDMYKIDEKPRAEFIKYLADLKVTEALALSNHKKDKAMKIQKWFQGFEAMLQEVFDDDALQLIFDEDKFDFSIKEKGKQEYNFNVLSSGYAAVLDIMLDLMLRMEKRNSREFIFEQPGIVLIDEIETHLHLELQKRILPMLTRVFPNIQFIVTTHSPFVLNSISNVVIYDLERSLLVEDGLVNMPYEGVVEGYFQADKLSMELKQKFERYKLLAYKERLEDIDIEELDKLEMFLDEIPDYLGIDIATEYRRIKLDLRERTDM